MTDLFSWRSTLLNRPLSFQVAVRMQSLSPSDGEGWHRRMMSHSYRRNPHWMHFLQGGSCFGFLRCCQYTWPAASGARHLRRIAVKCSKIQADPNLQPCPLPSLAFLVPQPKDWPQQQLPVACFLWLASMRNCCCVLPLSKPLEGH